MNIRPQIIDTRGDGTPTRVALITLEAECDEDEALLAAMADVLSRMIEIRIQPNAVKIVAQGWVDSKEILLNALKGVLAEPYGCTLCDSGKPRNEAKGHQPDCPFEVARAAINKATNG